MGWVTKSEHSPGVELARPHVAASHGDELLMMQTRGALGRVIACVGAVGGAGTTSMAMAIAGVNAQRNDTWFLDASACAGSAEGVLGAESLPGMRTQEFQEASGRMDMAVLAPLVVDFGGVHTLLQNRFVPQPLSSEALTSLIMSITLGGSDVVVDASARVLALCDRLWDAIVVVSPLAMRGLAGTLSVASQVAVLDVPVGLAVVSQRGRRGISSGRISPDQFAQAARLPLWSVMAYRADIASATEQGFGPLRAGKRSEKLMAQCASRALAGALSHGKVR